MTAGNWKTKIGRGAMWRSTLRYVGSAGVPIGIEAPSFMEIRSEVDEVTQEVRVIESGN